MKLGHILKAGIALAVVAAAASAAQAAAIIYFGNNPNANGGVVNGTQAGQDPLNQRNLFRNSLATQRNEAFNMATGPTANLSDLFGVGSRVSLQASDTNPSASSFVSNDHGGPANWNGRLNTTGDSATLLPSGGGGWFETNRTQIVISFTDAVSAFGTFFTDVGDFDGNLGVEIFGADGSSLIARNLIGGSPNAQGGLAFFGYTNDVIQFNRIVFSVLQPNVPLGQRDYIGFDDFITGTLRSTGGTVPEPTSLALVGLSLALLGSVSRRRNRA